MSDALLLVDTHRPSVDQNVARTSARTPPPSRTSVVTDSSASGAARPESGASPVGPFEHLLREIQQSARPRDSRVNESAASEMFESHASSARSPSANESRDSSDSGDIDASDSRNARTDRNGADTRRGVGEPNFAQDVDRRIAARPAGASPDRLHASFASKPSDAAAVRPPAPGSGSGYGEPSTPSRVRPPSETDRAPISSTAPQSRAATGGTTSLPSGPQAPPSAESRAGSITTNDDSGSASIAGKLAPVLAELVRDGAKSLVPSNGSFEEELAKFVGKQERLSSQTVAQAEPTSDASRATSETNPDRIVPPSPFDAFVRSIRLQGGESRSSARIRLNPPELGAMTVYVRVDGDRIRLDVRTETADAARRLQSHVAELKTALQQQGLSIDAIAIETVGAVTVQGTDTKFSNASRMLSRRHPPDSEKSKRSEIPPLPPRERGRGEGLLVWS